MKYPYIQEGDKIKFLKLKEQNPFKFDVISYMSTLPIEFKLKSMLIMRYNFKKLS